MHVVGIIVAIDLLLPFHFMVHSTLDGPFACYEVEVLDGQLSSTWLAVRRTDRRCTMVPHVESKLVLLSRGRDGVYCSSICR